MTTYKITSPEGAVRYGAEQDTTVELTLEAGEELAVTAAGWLEPVAKKPKEETQ
jgi:hypothetical protein